jgi:thiamine biosynthesis lipoprotein
MHISNLTAALAIAVTLASCSSPAPTNTDNSPHTRDVFAMDTYMSMKAYGENGEKALSEAEEYIKKLESDLSATSPDSCISRVNSADSKPTEITDEAAEIIAKALEIGKKTNGALDITLYPMLKEWGFTTGEYQIPKTEDISRILRNTGFERVQLSGNAVTVPDGFQIDLGALAKGFTSDKIMDIMRKNNVSSAIVSLGGNVQAVGTKPDGSQWKVAVRDPFAPDTDMCVVEIGSKAVITSGNYERFFTGSDGKNYWHILDPSDGFPADNGLVSVTVIGDSGLECDALSTALFVLGDGKAQDYWNANQGFDMILVTDDKRIVCTDGIADSFTNMSGMDAEVLSRD